MKIEYQNLENVMTDFVSYEAMAAVLGPDFNYPCFKHTYEADFQNAKERILERQHKMFIQGIIKKAFKNIE